MIRMETDVNSVSHIFEQVGFVTTRYGIYLKDIISGELSYWAAATIDGENILVTLGAIAPKINKFALGLVKKCSEGRVGLQFPASVMPPIFIAASVTIPMARAPSDIPKLIDDFEQRYFKYSIDDWFRLAMELTPYAPSQSVTIPSYLYLKKDRISLLEYLSKRYLANPAREVAVYLDKLEELANEL